MSVENQKIIRIKKTEVDRNFLKLLKEEMYAAMRELTGSELKLYLYLAANKVDYQLELSRSYLIEQGITSNGSYDRAVKGLIEKHYLVPLSPVPTSIIFIPLPKMGAGNKPEICEIPRVGKRFPKRERRFPEREQNLPK